ncbi:MAG: DUF1849 family protein [Gluconacetobacter diazotrophicus]|nr:DUF1849 family protein [Gluconacetobacter diazotrophicus]
MDPIRRRVAAVLLCGLLPAALPAVPAGAATASAAAVPLAAHDAAYDLSLASTHGGGTVAANGSMTFGIADTCDGWAARQVLHLQMVTREGQNTDLTSSYATLESKDGRHLSFEMQQREGSNMALHVRGDASLNPDGTGEARYVLPEPRTTKLPRGTLFPMAHTAAVIAAAEHGDKSASFPLFDGTGPDGASDTYVTVLDWHAPPSDSSYPPLAKLPSGRVHVAFFARKPGTITPDYEVGMRYFANGVSDRMVMDFGDFTMTGALRTFALAKPAKC